MKISTLVDFGMSGSNVAKTLSNTGSVATADTATTVTIENRSASDNVDFDELSSISNDDDKACNLRGLAMLPEDFSLKETSIPRHRRTASSSGCLEASKLKPILKPASKTPREKNPFSVSFKEELQELHIVSDNCSPAEHTSYHRSSRARSTSRPQRTSHHRRQRSAPVQQPCEKAGLKALQHSLVSLQQEYGPDCPMVAATYNLIGNAHFRAKEYDQAMQAYRNAVQCAPGSHLAASYANMGAVYWSTGQVDEAIQFLRKALHEHEFNVVSEAGYPTAAESLEKIASVQYQLGLAYMLKSKYDKAIKYLGKARTIREQVHGLKHVDVARAVDAMGKVYFLLGDLRASLACHEEALCIKQSCEDVDHNSIIPTMMNIAAVHRARNDNDAAMVSYTRVLSMQKKALRQEPSPSLQLEMSVTLELLGDLHTLRKEGTRAIDSYQAACFFLRKAGINDMDPRLLALKSKQDSWQQ